jgi:hypothetical protein
LNGLTLFAGFPTVVTRGVNILAPQKFSQRISLTLQKRKVLKQRKRKNPQKFNRNKKQETPAK